MRSLFGFLFGITKLIGWYPQADHTLPPHSHNNFLRKAEDVSDVFLVVETEKTQFSYNNSISDACVTKEQSLICYHKSNDRSGYSPIHQFERLISRGSGVLHYNSFLNCQNSAKKGQHLYYDPYNNGTAAVSIPLYTVGVDECRSTGNMIGFYFEAISFAQEEGFALGRIEFPRRCSDSQKDLLRNLPRIVLPYFSCNNFTMVACDKMLRYPWENPHAYMYRHSDMLGFINNKMVKNYVQSKSLIVSGLQCSIAIHYRCSDNFPIGLFPHDVFIQILSLPEVIEIAGKASPLRVAIHTDAVKGKGAWGDICWNLLGELSAQIALIPQYEEATISIQRSLPAHTYVYLHEAEVLICGASTFCIMSSFGANMAFIPFGTYLMRLNKPFAANIRLYNATMVKCSNETAYEEVTKRCQEPVHHQLWLEKMRNQTTSIVISK